MNNHRVIVTADDFGACNFIDNGIKKALREGSISCVSALINFEPRDSSHPNGAYMGSVAAINQLLADLKTEPYKKSKHVRIGLHLNFHAGSPVSTDHESIKELLQQKKVKIKKIKVHKSGKKKGQNKKDKKGNTKTKMKKEKVFVKVNDKPIFKTVNNFNPNKVSAEVFRTELLAQYKKFENSFGFDPDHLSAHFPVIFMAPDLFKIVCEEAKNLRGDKKPVPVRNPILVWQNGKKWAPEKEKGILKNTKKFWKNNSKARKEVNLKTKLANVNKLFAIFLNNWRGKAINHLNKNNISYPDYTNCNLYGNGGQNSVVIESMINLLLDFRPRFYNKSKNKDLSTEIIVHLGDFDQDTIKSFKGKKGKALENAKAKALKKVISQSPSGINGAYFNGRMEELQTITTQSKKLIDHGLFHYQHGLQLKDD